MDDYKPDNTYTLGHLARPRWNVLDILEHISRYSDSVHIFTEFNVEAAENLAERLSARGEKITVTAILLKAISIAQMSHPGSGTIRMPYGMLYERKTPIAGFTVEREIKGQQAVFFGNIRDCQHKPLAQIARELVAYGRNDIESVTQLTKEQMFSYIPFGLRKFLIPLGLCFPFVRQLVNPATFGLTSLGKFGLRNMVAPNVTTSIFGIGSMIEKPVVINGKIEIRKMMELTYSVDTKIYDMYQAARFLNVIKHLMETGLAANLHESEEIREQELTNSASVADDRLIETDGQATISNVKTFGILRKPGETPKKRHSA